MRKFSVILLIAITVLMLLSRELPAQAKPPSRVVITASNVKYLKQYKVIGPKIPPLGPYGPHSTIGLNFSAKSDRLAMALVYLTAIQVWDIASGRLIANLPYQETYPEQAIFSPDSSKLYTLRKDSTFRAWNLNAPSFRTVSESFMYSRMALSHDGKLLAATISSQEIAIWNTQTLKQVLALSWKSLKYQQVSDLIFSPDGSQLMVATEDSTCCAEPRGNASIILFDIRTGKQLAEIAGTQTTVNFFISRKTEAGWSAISTERTRISEHKTVLDNIEIWNTETGEHRHFFHMEPYHWPLYVTQILFDSTGSEIGIADQGGGFYICKLSFSECKNPVELHYDPQDVQEMFGLDGSILIGWHNIYSAQTGAILFRFPDPAPPDGPPNLPVQVGLSSDGTMIATLYWDSTVHLWTVQESS